MIEFLSPVLTRVLVSVCVVLFFTLAIFIHEFGHFLAARLLGLQVDAFSIGFGPAIWKRTIKGVEYKIGWILFGGYVALPQLDPSGMEKVQGDNAEADAETRELPEIAAWKRIIVSVAGPFGNVVLAVLLAFLISWLPGSRTGVTEARVGMVAEESPAWQAGLRAGDRIASVNGHQVATWNDLLIEWQLAGDAETANFDIERDGARMELALPLSTNNVFGLKILDGVFSDALLKIAQIVPESPAEAAGLRVGDVILALGDLPVHGGEHFISMIQKHGAREAMLNVRRGAEHLTVAVTPRFDAEENRPLIGIRWKKEHADVSPWMMYRDPWAQLKWDSTSIVRVLKALVAPKVEGERKAVAKNIGGPVMIIEGLYSSVRGDFVDGLGFLRMICVNLAILNLLPIPVLDGGHICFALYEIILRRKPHPRVVAALVNTCAILLIGLMLLLVYRDIARKIKYVQTIRTLERAERQQPVAVPEK